MGGNIPPPAYSTIVENGVQAKSFYHLEESGQAIEMKAGYWGKGGMWSWDIRILDPLLKENDYPGFAMCGVDF